MKAEIDSLHNNSVWELVQLPEGQKPVGSKWLFKVKQMLMAASRDVKPVSFLKDILKRKDSIMMRLSVWLYNWNLFTL